MLKAFTFIKYKECLEKMYSTFTELDIIPYFMNKPLFLKKECSILFFRNLHASSHETVGWNLSYYLSIHGPWLCPSHFVQPQWNFEKFLIELEYIVKNPNGNSSYPSGFGVYILLPRFFGKTRSNPDRGKFL